MFSGSAVIDKNNTAGWGKNTLVAAYTASGETQTQCIAYSIDKGRTFTKYERNPVIRNERFKSPGSRDPKVIWNEPNREWFMILYEDAGVSFFTSKNLKDWEYQGHLNGFYECPELFELPVDGDPGNTLWLVYGASGTYMLGDFDGRRFIPTYGKYRTTYGNQYAAQTYNNTPDGRRIQIGWGTIPTTNMPFNQMMCFPTELSLRSTHEGIRLFSEPIKEIKELHLTTHNLSGLSTTEANQKLKEIDNTLLHVIARVESLNGSGISITYNGNRYIHFNADGINDVQTPLPDPGKLIFDIELIIDRTSIESFFQKGQIVFVQPLNDPVHERGLEIPGNSVHIKLHKLVVYELGSIW
jgi:sucrose-6-phosphate hydrolase SacC (GH32 family)